jgi:hypothetical protein
MKMFLVAVLLGLVSPLSACAQTGSSGTGPSGAGSSGANSGFSFDVYGDSRSMMYLPYQAKPGRGRRKLMTDMFELVLPEKVAAEVVDKGVKLIYDPSSHELVQLVMPFDTRSEVTTLTLDKGWVTSASVEDVKLLPGVAPDDVSPGGRPVGGARSRQRHQGRTRQFSRQHGRPRLVGETGRQAVRESVLDARREGRAEAAPASRSGDAEGRPRRPDIPAVGNHEVWDDSDVEGLLAAFPYLKKLGVTDKQLIYKFDFRGVRFIYLDTGPYDYRQPSGWDAQQPAYDAQMVQLKKWLDEAKSTGIKKVFVSFHAPVYCRAGMGPIPEAQNPHKTLESYAKDLDIVVFNGHVHTTELFQANGVKYFVLGGGGAEQDPILPGRTSIKNLPADYPQDLYWKGEPLREEYNYLHVDVRPDQPTKFTINRFRPGSAEPYASVEVFK